MQLRSYLRSPVRLLLWSTICFFCLALNNILLFLDLVVVKNFDLSIPRGAAALVGLGVFIYGLIWEST